MECQDRVLARLCAWAWAIHLLSCFGCRGCLAAGVERICWQRWRRRDRRRAPPWPLSLCSTSTWSPRWRRNALAARSWRKPCRKHAWSSERVTSHHTLLLLSVVCYIWKTGCLFSWLKWSTITQKQHETESWNCLFVLLLQDEPEISMKYHEIQIKRERNIMFLNIEMSLHNGI